MATLGIANIVRALIHSLLKLTKNTPDSYFQNSSTCSTGTCTSIGATVLVSSCEKLFLAQLQPTVVGKCNSWNEPPSN